MKDPSVQAVAAFGRALAVEKQHREILDHSLVDQGIVAEESTGTPRPTFKEEHGKQVDVCGERRNCDVTKVSISFDAGRSESEGTALGSRGQSIGSGGASLGRRKMGDANVSKRGLELTPSNWCVPAPEPSPHRNGRCGDGGSARPHGSKGRGPRRSRH